MRSRVSGAAAANAAAASSTSMLSTNHVTRNILSPSSAGNSNGNNPHRRKSAVELTASLKSNKSGNSFGDGNKRSSVDNIYKAVDNNSFASNKTRSAATSPTSGSSYKCRFTGTNSSGIVQKNVSGTVATPSSTNSSPRRTGNGGSKTSNEAWVCPSDRQLALRAKLDAGWSLKTANMNAWSKQPDPMSSEEHEKILKVIEQAEALERAEQERVGKLIDRLEGMRHNRLGNGETECILCGETFRFYHHSQRPCAECHKMACGKCGMEYSTGINQNQHNDQKHCNRNTDGGGLGSSLSSSSSVTSLFTSTIGGLLGAGVSGGEDGKDKVWLCKICGEQREVWKKSGAWYFKSMPKYVLPEGGRGSIGDLRGHGGNNQGRHRRGQHMNFAPYASRMGSSMQNLEGFIASGRDAGGGGVSGNSSEEEGQLASRVFNQKGRRSRLPTEADTRTSIDSASSLPIGHQSRGNSFRSERNPGRLLRGPINASGSDITDDSLSIVSAPPGPLQNNGQYQGYSQVHGSKRNSIGNNNMVDYGDDAESDASTMTSASGTCVGYYDAEQDQSPSTRHSRSRIATMSAENIAARSSSVPGQARYVRPQFLSNVTDSSIPGGGSTSQSNVPQGQLRDVTCTNVSSMTNQEMHLLQQQSMMRARMPHGMRHPRNINPRCFRPPPPGYVLQRGPPRVPSGLPPPWAHMGGPIRSNVGPRQFRPYAPSVGTPTSVRSPAGSPIISPRGPGFPYGPRRGGPPPPGFTGHRGPPRHRMPRGGAAMYSPYQGSPHSHIRHPVPTSTPPNGSTTQYYSAPPSPVLKLQECNSNVDHRINVVSCKRDNDNEIDSSIHVHKMANQIKAQLHSDSSLGDDLPLRQIGSSNSKFLQSFEGPKENVPKDSDNTFISQNDSEAVRDTITSKNSSVHTDLETGDKNVTTEDSFNCSKGDSELQKPTYKAAKPFETSSQSRIKQTWRRLSTVRKDKRNTKRNKAEQRTGAERRDNLCAQTEGQSLAQGCDRDKFSVDNSPTMSRSLLPGGNNEHMISSSIPPTQSTGNPCLSVMGANFEGNPSSLGSQCGNHMRPPSTTSKESETEGVVTSGYFSRQESQSRGSDETLSSPRSPEGSYGIIEFSMSYDEADNHLLVNVIKAKKIRGMDANGLSDSYCKICLVPPLANKASSSQCTKIVGKSINPHYNATMHFTGVTNDILLSTSIHATILDDDLPGAHLLAEAKFSLQKILPQMQKKFQISLEKPNLKGTEQGLIVASNVGRVELSLAYFTKQGTLKVTILRCINLPEMDNQGSANPFVQVILQPSNYKSSGMSSKLSGGIGMSGVGTRLSGHRNSISFDRSDGGEGVLSRFSASVKASSDRNNRTHRTTTKWRTREPDFHEQFVYSVPSRSMDDLKKLNLHISVWDKENGRPDEYIGGIIVGISAKGSRLQHWIDMIKHPGQTITQTHFLSAGFVD